MTVHEKQLGVDGFALLSEHVFVHVNAEAAVRVRFAIMVVATKPDGEVDQPRGWYRRNEAAQLAGVSTTRLGQWTRHGYVRSSRNAEPRVYSYEDVAEAYLIHHLTELGVHLPAIKTAIVNLRRTFGDRWPLSAHTLYVVDDHPQANPEAPRKVIVVEDHDYVHDHPVVDELELTRVDLDLRRGGWVVREMPNLTHIEVDPDRLSGRPVIKGTRIPATDVALLAAAPNGRQTLREEYSLSPSQIDDAVAWHQRVTALAQPAAA